MQKILFLFVLLIAAPGVQAQQTDLIANIAGRRTIDLDGQWKTIIDPYELGARDVSGRTGFFKDNKPESKSDLIEYGFDSAESLNVPGDWNTQRDSLFFYEGTIWYRRLFNYQLSDHKRLFVYFGAANYIADVYLNGEKVGHHEGGFTPFNFEITRLVRPKDNFLIVRVNNQRKREGVPELMTDWWNYGGLTRGVSLVELPETFLQDYFLQLDKDKRIAGWVKLNGKQSTQMISVQIPEAGINHRLTTGSNGFAEISFATDLKQWSPEDPKLYRVAIAAETDQIEEQIGFRTIAVKGSEILLNGKPVFLRGVNIHEEAPFHGRAFSREDAQTLLGWARELGCNFVRLAHYPHNEIMVREADRLGLMVWSELPVYWGIQWDNPATLKNAQQQLGEEIARDKNRAAVILWSVANETPQGEARLQFLRQLIEEIRSLDSTRLITAAMLHHAEGETTHVIDDPLGQYLDVLGCNEYIGWYDGLPPKADKMEWKTHFPKPVIMSEFGAEALYGNHGDDLTRWSEEFQESFYRHQIGMLKRIPFLRGTSPWILMDFRSPRRLLPGIQDYYNRKGLLSNRGEKKKAFYVMQQFYSELQQKAAQSKSFNSSLR